MIDTRRYTPAALAVFTEADRSAMRLGHLAVDAEHFLLALTTAPGPVAAVLRQAGASPERLRAAVLQVAPRGPERFLSGKLPLGEEAVRVLRRAEEIAQAQGGAPVDPADLLTAILDVPNLPIATMLQGLGLDAEQLRQALRPE